MTLQQKFHALQPDAFFVESAEPEALAAQLVQLGWIAATQQIASLARAGEGNMNLVLRVVLDDGSCFILKQARPWAEKFPSVEAPAGRAEVEAEYYRRTAVEAGIADRSPRLLQADAVSHLLLLEDLGEGSDLSSLYRAGAVLEAEILDTLMDYLATLHGRFRQPGCGFVIENLAMRALNAAHIFRIPFAANLREMGLDLDAITPGLAALAADCREDAALQSRIAALEARYLSTGETLLHGDFFPGSVLRTAAGLKVIDPEFCFFGDAEFDLGVLIAHLTLAGQPAGFIAQGLARYRAASEGFVSISEPLCRQYAGIEILRRLLGFAQLPISLDLAAKQALIGTARDWLKR